MKIQRCVIAILLVTLISSAPALGQNAGRTLADRVVAGYDQVHVHEAWPQQQVDILPGSGRRLGGIYFSGGNGGYFSSGPGYGAYVAAVGPFMPYGYYGFRPWGFGYGIGAGGYWPGFGYGRYSYYYGQPAIYSANQLWGNNLQELWNPDGLGIEPPAGNIFNAPNPQPALQQAKPAKAPQPRLSNADAISRAWRWINIGDKYFAKQEYRQAYQRYKDAATAAPDLVDAWLRQGQAMVAGGQYPIAATAFKRGLKLDSRPADMTFRLDDLYGDLKAAKRTHLESVADAAERREDNGDLLLLVGLQLYFDGQTERAAPFLEQSAKLLADDEMLARIVQGLAARPIAEVAQP